MEDYSTISHDSDSVGRGIVSRRDNDYDDSASGSSIANEDYSYSQKHAVTFPTSKIQEKDNPPLRVVPSTIRFDSIEAGVLYVMTFSIKNATKVAQRIRISTPRTSYFALNYIPAGVVAPGLELRAEIECQLPLDSREVKFRDAIFVTMGDHKVEVPLVAGKAGPDIIFDSIVDFGLIAENIPTIKKVIFRNRGKESGTVTVVLPEFSYFRATPSSFEVYPSSEQVVQFRAECPILGPLREIASVLIEGIPDMMTIDLSAQILIQKVTLISSKKTGILENLDFGFIFFGDTRDTDALLVNNGPSPLAYTVVFDDDDESQVSPTSTYRCVTIVPSEGVLKAYSQLPIVIKYQPKVATLSKGFKSGFMKDNCEPSVVAARPIIEIPETGQRLELNVSGAACLPNYTLSPSVLRFGHCAVYERRDILVTFTNLSKVPMNLEFNEVAHFKISPSRWHVPPGQGKTFVASFMPTQLGRFKSVFKLLIENGIAVTELRMIGETDSLGIKRTLIGGPETLPGDFKKHYHFVDPKEISADRFAAKNPGQPVRNAVPVLEMDSASADYLYDQNASVAQTVASADLSAFNKVLENRHVYNDFLQKSHRLRQDRHLARVAKLSKSMYGYDRSDPFGKDLGMERGLVEPELKIPLATESLWLANKSDEKDSSRRIVFDENRLIGKKFSPQPISPSDIRDCSSEVSFDAMKSVISSHKILNFGRVSLNSVNFKNFAICNTLQRTIFVELGELEGELASSKPNSQIVPMGATAGFDITFSSKEVGKFHGYFIWNVNGANTTKVAVSAEVVPLEIHIDRKVIRMCFSDSSLETFVEEDIILTNPGNSAAEYLWGSSQCFTCSPVRGVIEQGQSCVTKLTWTPKPGASNEADLGLHVIGGVDEVLHVVGDLNVGKCAFKEKSISFGTVAVGMTYTYSCTIKNVGDRSTVFSFDYPPENWGVQLEPSKGTIAPGAVVPVKITLCPVAKLVYDKLSIQANVRGGKPISLKLTGEAIFPELMLLEKSYDFKQVAIGSECMLPMTITNFGSIPSAAVLNLNDFPELLLCLLKDYDTSKVDIADRKDFDEISDYHGNTIRRADTNDEFDDLVTGKPANRIWILNIKSGATISAGIIFRPTTAKRSAFSLPLQIQGLKDSKIFSRELICHGISSRITLSSFKVNFGDRIVSRDPMSRMSFFNEIKLSNDDSVGLSYEIRELNDDRDPSLLDLADVSKSKDSEPPVFFISPLKGELAPGMKVPIRITFMPNTNRHYEKNLGIFISGQPNIERPYQTILCCGSGMFPRLSFDVFSLALPVVPLHVTSRRILTVFNNGYDTLILRHRVSPTIPVPLEITYLDGPEIGYSIEKVRIEVAFRSSIPTSWSGKVEFSDDDGERFAVEVSGCADNCIFTVSPFISTYRDTYGFMGLDDQPVFFLSKAEMLIQKQKDAKKKELLRKQRAMERQTDGTGSIKSSSVKSKTIEDSVNSKSAPDINEGVDTKKPFPCAFDERAKKEVVCLLNWINTFAVKTKFDVTKFPECILATEGDIVVDFIETVSGKRVPGANLQVLDTKKTADPQIKTPNKLSRLLAKYKDIVTFLVKSGAMLNHMNIAYLLEKQEYIAALEADLRRLEGDKITPSMLSVAKGIWDQQWLDCCSRSWTEVLFQIVKIFVLSRVTYSSYKSTPGVIVFDPVDETTERDKKGKVSRIPPELKPSNIYSQSESVLLVWSQYHAHHALKFQSDDRALSNQQPHASAKHSKNAVNKRLFDPEVEFADWLFFCQIIHSHVPELTHGEHGALHGYADTDRSRKDELFKYLVSGLTSLRLNFDITAEDLMSSSRTMFLMILHMYLTLPCLIPKSTLEFKGRLGDPIVKIIELKNPSKRRIGYNVQLEGDKDFSIECTTVFIEAETSIDFNVKLNARFSKPIFGRIVFWGIRENGFSGANMVFKLASNIVGRKPVEVIRKSISLFETDTFSIKVLNPYPKESTFTVHLETGYKPIELSHFIGKLNKDSKLTVSKKQINTLDSPSDDLDIQSIFHEPLWSVEDKFAIPFQESKPLIVNVAPFKLGYYTCQVVLIEKTQGEICYEVALDVVLPRSEKIDFTAPQSKGGSLTKSLKIASKNFNFEKALMFASESRLNAAKRTRARLVLQSLVSSSLIDEELGTSIFLAEMLSPYFRCPKEIPFVSEYQVLQSSNPSSKAQVTSSANKKLSKVPRTLLEIQELSTCTDAPNTILISLFPEKAGVYNSKLLVFSKSNNYDLRVIDLTATITSLETHPTIEFKGPARYKVTLEIPITNESEVDWTLGANILGGSFSGAKALSVTRGSKEYYKIAFFGNRVGQFEGTLTLREATTNDAFVYKLLGIAEDPLAEDKLYFKVKARKRETCEIIIPQSLNISSNTTAISKKLVGKPTDPKIESVKKITYNVQTDLPHVSGASSIEVYEGSITYEMIVFSPIGGLMSGAITFTNAETGEIFWYTVDIDVVSPEAEGEVEVEAMVRKAASLEISLENPSQEPIEFNVVIEGEGLLGNNVFTLPPGDSESPPYELLYSPLREGTFYGSVRFINALVGEFWYKVILHAIRASPTKLDCIECMLGASASTLVLIENPLPEAIELQTLVSDQEHFFVNPEYISLGPYGQTTVNVVYSPSNLGDPISSLITFYGESFGELSYEASGKSLLPGVMEIIYISAQMNETGSYSIPFKNPFKHPLPVDIILTNESSDDIDSFSLVSKKVRGAVISAKSIFQIAVGFSPQKLCQYRAFVEVRSNISGREFKWCFPLVGVAEMGPSQRLSKITTRCKSSYLREIDVPLEGLLRESISSNDLSLADFVIETNVLDLKYRNLVERGFRVQTLDIVDLENNSSAHYALKCRLLFEPLKTFDTTVDLRIVAKGRGQWKLSLDLEATDQIPDDVVVMRCPVGKVDKVSFSVSNRFLGFSPFQAYITGKASSYFSVMPSSGILAPFGSEGTKFIITYSPTEYGLVQRANLTIVTDDAQWCYELKGTFPDSRINESDIKSKIVSTR